MVNLSTLSAIQPETGKKSAVADLESAPKASQPPKFPFNTFTQVDYVSPELVAVFTQGAPKRLTPKPTKYVLRLGTAKAAVNGLYH